MNVMAMPGEPAYELGSTSRLPAAPRLTLHSQVPPRSTVLQLDPIVGTMRRLTISSGHAADRVVVNRRRRHVTAMLVGLLRLRLVHPPTDPDAGAHVLCAAHAQSLPTAPAASDCDPLADVASVSAAVGSSPQSAAPEALSAAELRAAARGGLGARRVDEDVRWGNKVGLLCSSGGGPSAPVDWEAAVGAPRWRRHLRTVRTDQLSEGRVRVRGAGVTLGGATSAPCRLARKVQAQRGSPAVDNGTLMVVGRSGRQTEEEPSQNIPARSRPRLSPAGQQKGPWPPRCIATAIGTPGHPARVPQRVSFVDMLDD